jgi:phosphoribosylformylglycinamidine (FGAM) synthase-like amidotransferase family enzyme
LDTFQHHQLESVQREQLKMHIDGITSENGLIVGWMDYPENASIIDPKEQQSDYYDRSFY